MLSVSKRTQGQVCGFYCNWWKSNKERIWAFQFLTISDPRPLSLFSNENLQTCFEMNTWHFGQNSHVKIMDNSVMTIENKQKQLCSFNLIRISLFTLHQLTKTNLSKHFYQVSLLKDIVFFVCLVFFKCVMWFMTWKNATKAAFCLSAIWWHDYA